MNDKDEALLRDMLDAAQDALEFVRGQNRSALSSNKMLRYAVVRAIQIIGEAASQLSQPFRAKQAHIDWRGIIGMRHKVVHDYVHVDPSIVWDVVENDLQPLITELEKILPPEQPDE